jgi:hypothetical protein
MSSTTDFYLSALNIEITGNKLSIPGGDSTVAFDSSTYDAVAELECPLLYAQHLFQWHTNATDVNDLNTEDLKFRVFQVTDSSSAGDIDITYYNSRNLLVAEAVVTDNAVSYFGSGTVDTDKKKVHHDQARHISLEVLGTAEGVDIFNNERAFCLDLLEKSVNAFVENISDIDDATWNGTTDNNPAKASFRQILDNFPSRLTALVQHPYDANNESFTPDSSTTEDVWYYMPFEENDKIYFILNVKAHGDQGNITNESYNVSDRKYLIKLKLVSNLTDTAPGAYMRPWDAAGPVFSSEPAYLQPDANNDTVAPSAIV